MRCGDSWRASARPRRRDQSRSQLPRNRQDQVHVRLGGSPVGDRRPEGDLVRINGRSEVDTAVVDDGLAQPPVQVIERVLGDPLRPVAETGDVEYWLFQELEVRRR